MGKKYTADVRLELTVTFEDDGETALIDQAIDAVWEADLSPFDCNAEIVGGIKEQ